MPLFNYQCQKCGWVIEKFQHKKDEEVELACEECESEEFERVMGVIYNRTWENAKDALKNRILPDADRIQDKISKGSDNDFLDITGD